ncbi:aminotransferase class V-fold PLP-dependent enzyme [Nocardioides cheoyonin]|uniref:aminotransferase class V-fold PLP-dependent enzyme n=1 Tax=Nocardioides cheoyonin TaxID=3156615 RepID=UPI0032B4403B
MSHVSPLLPLVGAETRVPLLDGRLVTYANLDVAASAPALQAVADRVAEVLPWYASVHRGAGYLSQVSTSLYEESRRLIGEYVGARRDADVTVITRNTTDAVNLLAGCVPGRTLVVDVEHHANLLPWQRSRAGATVVTGGESVTATLQAVADELAAGDYALVALTGASNVTGEALPLREVVTLAHGHGARVFVDGAQLLAHRRFSLAATGTDYIAFSGHKLYAPFGAGALVGRRDWLDAGTPYLAGGGAVSHVTVDDVAWAPAPARHEGGSPNVIGAVALAAACTTLTTVPAGDLDGHEGVLRDRLVDGLAEIPGVTVVRLWEDSESPVGVVTFALDGADPGLLAAYLSAEHGLGVRDGRFCAHPLLARLGLPAGAVRVSLGVGTSGDEIERLLAGVRAFVADGPCGSYAIEDGCWGVVGDPRPPAGVPGVAALAATAGACRGAAVV